ncbi:MAG: TolC family protein [Planctomycetota bacterium]|nr:TolC family protein [Planctomycetota bacterium]
MLGIVGPAYVSRRPEIPKPVVAAVVVDPETEGIPIEIRERPRPGRAGTERVRVSGVPNLSYVAFDQDFEREVETFREITPFSRLAILTMEALQNELVAVRESVARDLQEIGVDATFLPVGRSIEQVLDLLPTDIEAVMLGSMPHLPGEEFVRLIVALHERKLPTYSLGGQRDVRRGVMASLKMDRNELFLVRRVALNLFSVLRGEDASELPVDFTVDEQLTINMASARAVGVDPTFALLTEAELVGETGPLPARRISLAAVVQEATNVNLDLVSAGRRVEAGMQLVKEARASLLPRASVSSLSTFLDKDRASVVQGQRQISSALGVQQVIYSEQARAGYDIERQLQSTREEERLQLRLDIVLEAAQSYLDVLRAKTIEDIQKRNLAVTRSNLSLARARVDVGTAGRDEVLRWRSQIAQNRRNVIDASAQRNQAEIAVNRILNRALEEPFDTVEADLDDQDLTVNFEVLRPFVERPGSFKLFREFMTREALEASPELRQLDASIRAQERSLRAAKRAFYVPTVSVDAQVQTFKNGGEPSQVPPGGPNNVNWTIGVQASLPLFQGGALRAQKARAQIELDQFRIDREATRLLIGQRIRSALHQAGASFAGIELSREAAEAARENLALVRDSYSEGAVDIVRVLDAQTQALSAELDAASAVFVHLIDLMETQRAVGRFDYFRSADERDEFIRRLSAFFQENGYGDSGK